jgi:EmrB/QacA subfamily drug resistance transporter
MAPTRTERLSAAQRWTLTVSCLAIALVMGSMAALYTALSDIAAETTATQSQLTWVVDGYTLAVACLVLPAGAVGDRYGRRKNLIGGLIVFAAASAIPLALADPAWLIAARTIAGAGAAFVMPSTLSIMTGEFPPEQRGRSVGIWAGVAASGAVAGILASGVILHFWSWRAIFAGLMIAAIALAVASWWIPESQDPDRRRVDVAGGIAIGIAVGLLVFGLIEGPHRGWHDPVVLGLFIGSALALTTFVTLEQRLPNPLIDLRLLANRAFAAGTLSLVLHFVAIFGYFFLIIQFLQLVRGYDPLTSALAMAPIVIPLVGISLIAPSLAQRWGLRLLISSGLATLAVSMYLTSRLTTNSTYLDILWGLLTLGVGLGLCTAPSTSAVMDATPVEKHGVAAAVNDATREIGASIGIAIAGSVLAAGYSDRIANHLAALPAPLRQPFGDSLAAATEAARIGGPALEPALDAARAAFVHGCHMGALALTAIAAAAALAVAFWAPGRSPAVKFTAVQQYSDADDDAASASIRGSSHEGS